MQRSDEGGTFVTIRDLLPVGSSNLGAQYTFEDKEAQGRNQYRLKMIDLDGTSKYSQIISVDLKCDQSIASELIMYPNKTRNISTLQFEIDESTNVTM